MEDNEFDEDIIDVKMEIYSDESSEDNQYANPKNNKKGTKLHTIQSKIKIIKYAKENTDKQAIIKYGIPYTTLRDWKKNEEKFLNLPDNKLKKRTLHKGTSIINLDLERKLINFIEYNRKLFNPITTWCLLLKVFEYAPERKNKSIKTNQQLIYRFLKRNHFSFRTKTHIGSTLDESAFIQASLFLNVVWNNRKNYGFYDEIIGNMDETPVFFNMVPSKTVAYKGQKSILIKTQDQEKCRITVLLTITAAGGKLPPYIIFKAKNKGKIEKLLQTDPNVQLNKCFVACNQNAWSTEDIIKDWYAKVWLKYLSSNELDNDEKKGYLILDKATSHYTNNLISLFNKGDNIISFIPGGLTRFFQPLDVSINKPFKQALKEKYVDFCLNNASEDAQSKMSRTKMIQCICDIWYDEKIISKEMVYKSFRVTGIGNKLDRSEDPLFGAWAKMKNEIPLIETDLEDDYPFNKNDEILDDEED